MSFDAFGLDPRLLTAIEKLGFEEPTPIQSAAIPPLLEGRDVIGRARTGSGKTAAFGLPLLNRLGEGGSIVRGLVLAPTRELALQVTEALRGMAKKLPVRIVTIYGGTSYGPQLNALRAGAPIVVATPGRLLDHIDRGNIDLSQLEVLVLDEADEMLRMGFIDDVTRVFELAPANRQVCLFSATMPDPIRRVAEQHITNPVELQVEDRALSVDHIEQRGILVPQRHKIDCLDRVLRAEPLGTHLVFARTRASCAELADSLALRGVPVDALHGDLNQGARERVLARLRAGRLNVVIATDVAARGIDVEHITHVINYDLPPEVETYVHRIGRTGRAGASGVAISFVTPGERSKMRHLERMLKVPIEPMEVPSDAEIARGQREALIDRLRTTLEEEDLSDIREWIRGMLQDSDRSDEDVAAAAIHLLTEQSAGGFETGTDDGLPAWARGKKRDRPDRGDDREYDREDRNERPRPERAERPPREDRHGSDRNNEVELFLAAGRNKGIRPGDLVGALFNEVGVPEGSVGRVTVGARTSFVGLPRDVAKGVLAEWDHLPIRGMQVPMLLARPQGERPPQGIKHKRQRGPKPKR